ncbi:MAG: NTP transferase domain-containing protein [Propionibacterium sp.]|nr:NTP transferase domain-containing protein [Propionibacterium sp.]
MTVALIIGGGRSSRMGSNKLELTLEGRTLLERTLDAIPDAELAIVVAERLELRRAEGWPDVRFTLEEPAFGGPVAGISAGVRLLEGYADDEVVIVLPIDAVSVGDAARALAAAEPGVDGVVLQDEEGWPQYLFGRYRLGALRRGLVELDEVRDLSVRKFGTRLDVATIVVDEAVTADVDTPEQAELAGILVPGQARKDDPVVMAKVDAWQRALRDALGLGDAPIDVPRVLELSGVTAKEVARPAVPVTSYCVGLAVGVAWARGEDVEEAAARAFGAAMAPGSVPGW